MKAVGVDPSIAGTAAVVVAFVIPAIPVAQPRQRQRVVEAKGRSFVSNYTPTKHPVNAFKAATQCAADSAYRGPPLDEPLSLKLLFVMPRPKQRIWKAKPMPREHHAKRPDCDNLAKSVLDALSGLLWRDDALIYSLQVHKVIASGDEQPHVEVRLESEVAER